MDENVEELTRQLRRRFVAQCVTDLVRARRDFRALAAGDEAALLRVRDLFHRIAGSASLLELTAIAARARAIEESARALIVSDVAANEANAAMLQQELERLTEAVAEARLE